MKVPPFVRKTSDGIRSRSFNRNRSTKAKSSKNSVCPSSDGTEPDVPLEYAEPIIPLDHYATPSVESTVSNSSGSGQEMPLDWATATMVRDSGVVPIKEKRNQEVSLDWATATMVEDSVVKDSAAEDVVVGESGVIPIKKKRPRSFREKLFGGSKPRAYKTDRKLDFSLIDSPLKSPMPVHLQYGDSSVASESTYGYSLPDHDDVPTTALNVKSRSVKKLAPPKEEAFPSWLNEDDTVSNPFDNVDPYLAIEERDDESEGEHTKGSEKSTFSIPLSHFVKKSSSWGMASGITETVGDESYDKIVLEERHWGKAVRSRSRDSTSWIPTEEERYKIAQAFIYGEEEAKDDDESSVSATTGAATEVTGDTGITGGTEYTNETTSAYTGYYSGDESTSIDSRSTEKSYVTGTTGDVSMFSLEVDDSSKSTQITRQRRRRSSRKRRKLMIKSDQNLLVEVFADLRLLAEDMADEEQGFSGCLGCA